MKGYIKLHREIENHWLWEEPRRLRAWIYLLFEAAWEAHTIPWGKDETVTLHRGQLATSIRKLNGRWGFCTETTISLLRLFEEQGMITRETSAKRSLITIVNYEKYQLCEDSPERKVERKTKHNKRKEEITNKIITPSREQDLLFYEELKSDDLFFEQAAMSLSAELSAMKKSASSFRDLMLGKCKYHSSYSDYRQHFFNWLNLELQKSADKINTNNYGQSRPQTIDKYEARRGTRVGAKKADDFKESF